MRKGREDGVTVEVESIWDIEVEVESIGDAEVGVESIGDIEVEVESIGDIEVGVESIWDIEVGVESIGDAEVGVDYYDPSKDERYQRVFKCRKPWLEGEEKEVKVSSFSEGNCVSLGEGTSAESVL